MNSTETIRVFFSWQTDLPTDVNTSLIRKALHSAFTTIHGERSDVNFALVEATSNTSGAPNISQTLFHNIDTCSAFVADISIINNSKKKNEIEQKKQQKQQQKQQQKKTQQTSTIISSTQPTQDPTQEIINDTDATSIVPAPYPRDEDSREMPNPNVLVELGYAIHHVKWDQIILVANTAYGEVTTLPFDIAQHRVTVYKADPSMSSRQLEKAQNKLADTLHVAISAIANNKFRLVEHLLNSVHPQLTSRLLTDSIVLVSVGNIEALTQLVDKMQVLRITWHGSSLYSRGSYPIELSQEDLDSCLDDGSAWLYFVKLQITLELKNHLAQMH